MMRPTASLRLPALLALVALSCGGAQKPAADDSSDALLETPETRCIAIARGTRERRRDEPQTVVVKHVLVHFVGAKKAKPDVKRTRGDACLRALEARKQLQAGETFAEVVTEYSDEAGAASREGLIGTIRRTDVVPAFADAAFELGPKEVSHVVETESGFHVILRQE